MKNRNLFTRKLLAKHVLNNHQHHSPVTKAQLTKAMVGKFPWAKPKRVYKFKNFELTTYKDGSRLYLLKNGGQLILTKEGVNILRADPKVIKRYLKGEKMVLAEGGCGIVNLVSSNEKVLAVKEHHSGISAQTQMEHGKENKAKLIASNTRHAIADYLGSFNIGRGMKLRTVSNREVSSISVMNYIDGRKVSTLVEELVERAIKGDKTAMKKRNQLLNEYERFERLVKSKKLSLTDFHEGNVLAKYSPNLKKWIFTLIDQ
jgi:hypothetical protein